VGTGKCEKKKREINKGWKEYTEELYKKGLNDWIIMMVWLFT